MFLADEVKVLVAGGTVPVLLTKKIGGKDLGSSHIRAVFPTKGWQLIRLFDDKETTNRLFDQLTGDHWFDFWKTAAGAQRYCVHKNGVVMFLPLN